MALLFHNSHHVGVQAYFCECLCACVGFSVLVKGGNARWFASEAGCNDTVEGAALELNETLNESFDKIRGSSIMETEALATPASIYKCWATGFHSSDWFKLWLQLTCHRLICRFFDQWVLSSWTLKKIYIYISKELRIKKNPKQHVSKMSLALFNTACVGIIFFSKLEFFVVDSIASMNRCSPSLNLPLVQNSRHQNPAEVDIRLLYRPWAFFFFFFLNSFCRSSNRDGLQRPGEGRRGSDRDLGRHWEWKRGHQKTGFIRHPVYPSVRRSHK